MYAKAFILDPCIFVIFLSGQVCCRSPLSGHVAMNVKKKNRTGTAHLKMFKEKYLVFILHERVESSFIRCLMRNEPLMLNWILD